MSWLTWKTPVLKKRREPPPAATVLMSSWGAWMVTPALSAVMSYNVAIAIPCSATMVNHEMPAEKHKTAVHMQRKLHLQWCSRRHAHRSLRIWTHLSRCRPCQSQSSAALTLPVPPTAWSAHSRHTCKCQFMSSLLVPCPEAVAGSQEGEGLVHRKAHPPAGPDRTALWPENEETGDSPPSDCMKDSWTCSRPSSKPP